MGQFKTVSNIRIISKCRLIYAISTGCGYGQNVAYIGQELGMQTKFPISLMVDCQPAIQYAQNTGNKTRLKHIDIRSAMVQELRDSNIVKYVKTPSVDQKADALTKLMTRSEHELS